MKRKPNLERDFVGYGPAPVDPKWPNGARVALNFVINVEEGAEASVGDGYPSSEKALTEGGSSDLPGRDLAAESMFEYGSRVGFWRVVRMFEQRGMPATIMACALALERNPAIASHLRKGEFDICAHGYRWELHQRLSLDEERLRIRQALDSIEASTGARPEGWYCRYGPSINTRALLVEQGGLLYDSDAYNDELPYWVDVSGSPHLVVPYGLVNNDAKFMRGALATGEQFFEFLRDGFDLLYAEGEHTPKMMSVGLHLRIIGHPARAAGLQRFLDYVGQHDHVWVCRRSDIARHWRTHHQPR